MSSAHRSQRKEKLTLKYVDSVEQLLKRVPQRLCLWEDLKNQAAGLSQELQRPLREGAHAWYRGVLILERLSHVVLTVVPIP